MRSKSISRLALLGIAATALLLAALACGKSECPEDIPMETARRLDYQGRLEYLGELSPEDWIQWMTELYEENHERYEAEEERAHAVRGKYDDMFWRQPNVHSVGVGALRTGGGGYIDLIGINIYVTERVCQEDLPPEDRIPEVLEGVPVRIIEEPIPVDVWGP